MRLVHIVTGLGDSALLLPGSAALLAYLLWRRHARVALAWLATLALCLGLTALAKVAFLACGGHLPTLRMDSPSGHASFSAAFYGACAVVAAFHRPRLQRLAIHGAAIMLVLVIGASRVALGAHSPEEVLSGLLIGGLCVQAFALAGAPAERRPIRMAPLALVLALMALAVAATGRHLSAEAFLESFADHLAPAVGCAASP